MAYTGTSIKDLDTSTPAESTGKVPELNDSDREIKTVIKNQYAINTFTSTPQTLSASHHRIVWNMATASTTNFPTATDVASSGFEKEYLIENIGAGVNTLNATITLNGVATASPTLAQYDKIRIWTDGTTWYGMKFSSTPAPNICAATDINSSMSSAATYYVGIFMSSASVTTEPPVKTPMPVAGTIKFLYAKVSGNSLNGSTVITLRKNATDTALTVTIPAGSTSTVSDLTHAVDFIAGDLLAWSVITAGSSGALNSPTITALLVGI